MANPAADSILQALKLAQQHLGQRRLREAEILYRQVLAADPENAQATHGVGLVAFNAGRPEIAVEFFSKSVKLNSENATAQLDFGNALLALGWLDEAIAAYRQALRLQPNFAGAASNLGIALYENGQVEECLESFNKAAQLSPDLPEAHNNVGNVLKLLGRFEEAIAAYQRAIRLREKSSQDRPALATSYNNLGSALKESGRLDEALAAFRKSIELNPNFPPAQSNLANLLQFDPRSSPQTIFKAHRDWNDRFAQPLVSEIRPHGNDRSPDRRLRIGYVSPDFREHSAAWFLEGLLKSHDSTQVEVFCYASAARRPDATTTRLQQYVPNWRNITGQSDLRVAELIQQDRIDILVDLAGHTAGNRLLVFARKPAPIQITYLGYPNTTGLDAIDYRMTDANADPPGMTEPFHCERLLRLPETFACYTAPFEAPADVKQPPALSAGQITFGSFNTLAKINDDVIACWAQILNQTPSSRLFMAARALGDATSAQRVHETFWRHGVAPGRIEMFGYQDLAEYLLSHEKIDLLLDTFPANGHTITCHALWMGVPVICLAGKTHVGRLGVSVLNNLGLGELVADSPQQYVKIATELAGNLPRLAELRSSMRDRMKSSPLMDAPRFARNVERAYRTLWQRWSAGPYHL